MHDEEDEQNFTLSYKNKKILVYADKFYGNYTFKFALQQKKKEIKLFKLHTTYIRNGLTRKERIFHFSFDKFDKFNYQTLNKHFNLFEINEKMSLLEIN
jgi:hypothetical protein